MTTYSTDSDLRKYRPNIMEFGDDWSDQREEAYAIINRLIETRWYRKAAIEMGYDPIVTLFDSTKVKGELLKRAECFKTLELIFMYLKKEVSEEDGYERFEKTFRDRYNEEISLVLAAGIDYDWSGSGVFEDEELKVRVSRRLVRA